MEYAAFAEMSAPEKDVYRDAWHIAEPGAVNPLAVAGTLTRASKVIMDIYRDTSSVRQHPALKVIAGQLAMLFNVDRAGADFEDYEAVRTVFDQLGQ